MVDQGDGSQGLKGGIHMESMTAVLVYFDGATVKQQDLGQVETYAKGMKLAYGRAWMTLAIELAKYPAWVLFSDGVSRQAGIQLTTEYIRAHGI